MPTPPLWQLASCIDSDPGVALYVEQIDVVEDRGGLATANQTKVRLVYFGGGVTRSGGRWLLPRDWGQKPGASGDVKNEEIIEELMEIASSENIEHIGLGKVDHGMAGSRSWDCYWTLFIVEDLVPHLICKVEEVHVIEKICEVWASHNPHLLGLRVSFLYYFKRNSWAGPWL